MTIQVKDKSFRPYLSNQKIMGRIAELAQQINLDYNNKEPLFIAILNGSFMFAAHLFERINMPSQITFVKVASYSGTSSTGKVTSIIGLDVPIVNKHIIIVEDIIDTGNTMNELLKQLSEHQPASIKIASLIQKPAALQHKIDVHYTGFSIANDFIVGFGLDYDGYGRNLPDIYQVED
ncbi:MAG: hypoxanthine phosphoribosyltransferase [Bacteroidota bacterium]|jgi:hypoxanthine phosphoribosyltransferase